MVLGYDGLCFAQRCKPPLDLKVFISSGAFYNSPFFYAQLEFSRRSLLRSPTSFDVVPASDGGQTTALAAVSFM